MQSEATDNVGLKPRFCGRTTRILECAFSNYHQLNDDELRRLFLETGAANLLALPGFGRRALREIADWLYVPNFGQNRPYFNVLRQIDAIIYDKRISGADWETIGLDPEVLELRKLISGSSALEGNAKTYAKYAFKRHLKNHPELNVTKAKKEAAADVLKAAGWSEPDIRSLGL